MKPVEEQTILITGSTDGLGRATAQELAALDANVIIHGRDQERINATTEAIIAATGNRKIKGYLADLAELAQVRRFARDVTADNDRLDLLINNAGIGGGHLNSSHREMSIDGVELRFAVNYLAPFLLTRLLLPLLQRSTPSRIVNVASIGQLPIDFDDVMLEKDYDGFRAYRQSKLAQIMDTIDLAEELKGTGVTVNCLHPASLMDTKMVREFFDYTMSTVQSGVDALMHLATSPEFDHISGAYYDQKTASHANDQAYDAAVRKRLKHLSMELSGLSPS